MSPCGPSTRLGRTFAVTEETKLFLSSPLITRPWLQTTEQQYMTFRHVARGGGFLRNNHVDDRQWMEYEGIIIA